MQLSISSENPRLTIRFATEADVGLILEFIRALAEYEKLAHEVVADEAGLRAALFGERKFAEVLIAELEGLPAGFALFFHNFSTFLGKPGIYLEDLFVKPELRGKGIGKRLLAELAKIATERGCGRLEWWVLDWNEPAIRFYKSLGARPMDEWTVFRLTGTALSGLAKQCEAPAGYDETYRTIPDMFGTNPETMLVRYASRIDPAFPVLDIGAGQGRNALYLARLGLEVVAIDPSSVAVESIHTTASDERLAVSAHVSGFDDWSVPDSTYSAVMVFGLIQILDWDSMRDLVERVWRWTRPGGLVFVTGFTVQDASYSRFDAAGENTDKEAPERSEKEFLERAPERSEKEFPERAPENTDKEAPERSEKEFFEPAPECARKEPSSQTASKWRPIGKNAFANEVTGEVRSFLEPGEILTLFAPFQAVHHWEGLGPEHRHGDGPLERHTLVEAVFCKK